MASAGMLVSVLVAATGTMVRVSNTGFAAAEDAPALALAGLFAIETGELCGLALLTTAAAVLATLGAGAAGELLAGAAAGELLADAATYDLIVEVTVLVIVEIDSVVMVLVPMV